MSFRVSLYAADGRELLSDCVGPRRNSRLARCLAHMFANFLNDETRAWKYLEAASCTLEIKAIPSAHAPSDSNTIHHRYVGSWISAPQDLRPPCRRQRSAGHRPRHPVLQHVGPARRHPWMPKGPEQTGPFRHPADSSSRVYSLSLMPPSSAHTAPRRSPGSGRGARRRCSRGPAGATRRTSAASSLAWRQAGGFPRRRQATPSHPQHRQRNLEKNVRNELG